MKILFPAAVRGMCGGVRRALELVEQSLQKYPPPLFVLHEIVHNTFIVENLKSRGVRFVESLEEVPEHGVVVFSAHGVARAVEVEAAARHLTVVDASCPLVKRVHEAAARAAEAGETVLLIGHRNHPEVVGTLGRLPAGGAIVLEKEEEVETLPDSLHGHPLRALTQTTLSDDDTTALLARLRERFPHLEGGGNLCNATLLRQRAMRDVAKKAELAIILGSAHSSNARRLREAAAAEGCRTLLLERAAALDCSVLEGVERLAFSAGASVPAELETELLERLAGLGYSAL